MCKSSGQSPETVLTDPQQYPGVERVGSKPVASAPPIKEKPTLRGWLFLPVNALFAKHGAWSMLVKWTKMALRSVDEIADSIARDNSTRASSFVLEL